MLWMCAAGPTCAQQRPEWAFFVPNPESEKLDPALPLQPGAWTRPGSSRTYSGPQLEDPLNPPDWYPDEHPAMPEVVARGGERAQVRAAPLPCALCHLPNGAGHVESASLAGLSVGYIEAQFAAWRDGARHVMDGAANNGDFLTALKGAYTPAQVHAAAEYYAALTPRPWIRVVESRSVAPSAVLPNSLMRLAIPGQPLEPLGERIVELPEDPIGLQVRDSHSGFVAYVPVGSVAAGRALVTHTPARNGQMPCTSCHGARLTGLADIPPLAGRQPSYMVRQLWGYKSGTRSGAAAAPMIAVAAHLSVNDMLCIAAYLASLPPR